ncbi:MAG: pyridoxal kinase [Holosporaceae bacterium]|jgi:pyridoxine kinase|nr:pyridoxal kinase [Holosporaceae bacterium]
MILSIQSHVSYGYVGNKAAVFPLQSLGFDVVPVNTVQFSNHTGYGKWRGEVFSAEHIMDIAKGIEDIGQARKCTAILSGYMGSREICETVQEIVKRYKSANSSLLYLCDPVMGGKTCFVKPEVVDFFKENLLADVITPNQYEAELLSNVKIDAVKSLKIAANYFHEKKIKIVAITGVSIPEFPDELCVFVSDAQDQYIVKAKEYNFSTPINGTGDLLAALFLGYYLKIKEIAKAAQYSAYFTQKVLKNTFNMDETELQVLSEKYQIETVDNAPELVRV